MDNRVHLAGSFKLAPILCGAPTPFCNLRFQCQRQRSPFYNIHSAKAWRHIWTWLIRVLSWSYCECGMNCLASVIPWIDAEKSTDSHSGRRALGMLCQVTNTDQGSRHCINFSCPHIIIHACAKAVISHPQPVCSLDGQNQPPILSSLSLSQKLHHHKSSQRKSWNLIRTLLTFIIFRGISQLSATLDCCAYFSRTHTDWITYKPGGLRTQWKGSPRPDRRFRVSRGFTVLEKRVFLLGSTKSASGRLLT